MAFTRRLVLPLVLQALIHSRQVAAYCYYDSYGSYYCTTYYLPTASLVGIAISVIAFFVVLIVLLVIQRKKRAARNALLLQQQNQGQANQWVPPPYGGYPNNGGYPMQMNNVGYLNQNKGPQPFQPGYTGNYTGPGSPPPTGYDVSANTPTNVQEPPRTYNPEQPVYNPPGSSPPPPPGNATPHPPVYAGFPAPGGPPPQNPTGLNYTPPDAMKA